MLQRDLRSEIDTLGYPQVALFGIAVAVIPYDAMAAVQATPCGAHGADFADQELSHYQVAEEIEGPGRGMVAAIPEQGRRVFRESDSRTFSALLIQLVLCAETIRLRKAKCSHRTTPAPKRHYNPGHPHIFTARVLAPRKKT